jgi:hypothetical protein
MKTPTLEQFLKDIASHQLTVNLDQGVFRDLTIARPNTVSMHYNITTRPGYLVITGDMGSFVFSRLDDMFNFFRSDDGYEINLGYWGEKVEAGEVRKFDIDIANSSVQQYLTNFLEDLDLSDPDDRNKSKQALEAINDFISGTQGMGEFEFWNEIHSWDSDEAGGLDLTDFFESTTTKATYHYIWCCYAIVHAIKLYDAEISKEQSHECQNP